MTNDTPAATALRQAQGGPLRQAQGGPAPTPPGFLSSSLRVFDLSLGEMLWSRRTIFMALVVGAPVFIALVLRLLVGLGAPFFDEPRGGGGLRMNGPGMFGLIIWGMYLRFIVPVLGVFYGTSLMADEVEDKTITYLFTRPIPRGAVLVGKYIAYLACTVCVVLPSVVLVYLLIVPLKGSLGAAFPDLLKDLLLLGLGLAVYGAVFAFVGSKFKRPLLVGLIFVFGWEQATLAFPGYLKQFTVMYYLQAIVPHAMPSDGVVSLIQGLFRETPSLPVSLFWLAAIWAIFLTWGARIVARKEYVLEQ
jgi:ABC-type transport system involved in multi-copper enzyme maturation permease subunit